MKMTRIAVHKADLPWVGGTYARGRGNAITVARISVVVIETDADQGWHVDEAIRAARACRIWNCSLNSPAGQAGRVRYRQQREGRLCATDTPGLGLVPKTETLGAPVFRASSA